MRKEKQYKKNYSIQKNIFGKKLKFYKKLKKLKWRRFVKKVNPIWKIYKSNDYRSRLNRQYYNDLKMKKQIKIFYGGLTDSVIRNSYKKTTVNRDIVQLLESRLSTIIYRAGFCLSMKQAYQMVNHGNFLVNSKIVYSPGLIIKPNDIIEVKPDFWKSFYTLMLIKYNRKNIFTFKDYNSKFEFLTPKIIDLPKPVHLEINWKTLSILVMKLPKLKNLYFVQHLDFSKLKRFFG